MARRRWLLVLVCTACFGTSPVADDGALETSGGSTSVTTSTTNAESGSTMTDAVDGSATSVDPSSTGGGGCPDGVEVPAVEPPWTGPVVLVQGEPMAPPPTCPMDFVDRGVVFAADAEAPCACDCEEPLHTRCNLQVATGDDLQCDGGSVALTGPCTVLPGSPTHGGPRVTEGTCTLRSLPRAPRGPVAMCEAPPSSEGCLEPQGFAGPCIFVEGSMACPPGYPVTRPSKRVQCSPCAECQTLPSYCEASILITGYADAACAAAPVQDLDSPCSTTPGEPTPMIAAGIAETMPMACTTESQESDLTICCTQ